MATYDGILDWFEWNGEKSSTKFPSMHVNQLPNYQVAKEREEKITIPGRSGSLTILEGDNVYDEITKECVCTLDDPSDIPALAKWLSGYGTVKFADRTNGYFKARIANQISFDKILAGNPHRAFKVQFRCYEPYFYLDSGDTVITVTHTAGGSAVSQQISNPGNTPSRPLIKLTGTTGIGTITIGGKMLQVQDFTGHTEVTLDCEAKLAYSGTKSAGNLTLLTGIVSGEWITVPPGNQSIQLTGNITKAEITPRWRDNV